MKNFLLQGDAAAAAQHAPLLSSPPRATEPHTARRPAARARVGVRDPAAAAAARVDATPPRAREPGRGCDPFTAAER